MTIHRFRTTAVCPVDQSTDIYDVTVEVSGLLPVEDIHAALRSVEQPIYQEDLTNLLATELNARVTTVGMHSGIETTCVYGTP